MAVIMFLSNSVGHDLDADTRVRAVNALENSIMKGDAGTYAKEPDHAAFAKLFDELSKDLVFDANGKKFAVDYRTKLKQSQEVAKKNENDLFVTRKALQDEQAKYTAYEKKLDGYYKAALADIGKGNNAALAAIDKNFKYFADLVKQNQQIQDEKLAAEATIEKMREALAIADAKFNKLLEEKKNATLEVVSTRKNGDQQHALFLDISRGIPLWDRPVGKVTRVDLDRRQVFINLGSAAGVRPELTFNIFADDGKGNADKYLKGTIEIIRVVDAQTSMCRLTSLYDAKGFEISLNDPSAGRAGREVENAIREGDLIFNMFWNSRIAIAGGINFTGFPIDIPAEQMRHVEQFMNVLSRMGVATDAYLDLTDGQTKGGMTNKTRFLILGDWVEVKNPNDEAQKERAKLINDGIAAMRKEAIEKGMFLISAENVSIASGYRRARNANNLELGKFNSSVPFSGASTTGLVIQRDRPPNGGVPAPMVEKKEPEKKEEAKEKDLPKEVK
jgi:hypothetical protein